MLAPREVGRRAGAPRVPRPLPAPRSPLRIRAPRRRGAVPRPDGPARHARSPLSPAAGPAAARGAGHFGRALDLSRSQGPRPAPRRAGEGCSVGLVHPAARRGGTNSREQGNWAFLRSRNPGPLLSPPSHQKTSDLKETISFSGGHQRPANPPFSSPQAFRRSGPSPGPQRWRLRRSCGSGVGRGRPLRS